MITGERFATDNSQQAQDYAQELVLREDTDVFLMFVPKIDIDVTDGFGYSDAEFFVTTCVDPRMIGVLLGVFSPHYDEEKSMWGFIYQDLQVPHVHEEKEEI